MLKITCIICAYNPRMDYLNHTLDSLRAQRFACEDWEFILVDNNSDEPLSDRFDLSGLPHARCVVEAEPGLTHARLCGIAEAKGEYLIFIDDDNILAENYLSTVSDLFEANQMLGCIGGALLPRFEVPPPAHSEPFWECLALREVTQIEINDTYSFAAKPFGAGMALRSEVAKQYAGMVTESDSRKGLGRVGQSLGGCEDIDLAFTACDLSFCCGLFPQLRLTHLIDARRVEWAYLKKIAYGANVSYIALAAARNFSLPSRLQCCRVWLKELVKIALHPSKISVTKFVKKHHETRGLLKGLSLIEPNS